MVIRQLLVHVAKKSQVLFPVMTQLFWHVADLAHSPHGFLAADQTNKTKLCLRVLLDIVVCFYNTFDNNFEIGNNFFLNLMESY